MFRRPGVQRDYLEGDKDIIICGNNVESVDLKMKHFIRVR